MTNIMKITLGVLGLFLSGLLLGATAYAVESAPPPATMISPPYADDSQLTAVDGPDEVMDDDPQAVPSDEPLDATDDEPQAVPADDESPDDMQATPSDDSAGLLADGPQAVPSEDEFGDGPQAVPSDDPADDEQQPMVPDDPSDATDDQLQATDLDGPPPVGETRRPAAKSEVTDVTTDQLVQMMKSVPPPTILDARTGKWNDGRRIPGAKVLGPKASVEEVAKVAPAKDARIVTYCQNPKCGAGPMLAKHLVKLGYKYVFEYPDGIEGWVKAGQKVETAPPQK